jgi:hypothetical protein
MPPRPGEVLVIECRFDPLASLLRPASSVSLEGLIDLPLEGLALRAIEERGTLEGSPLIHEPPRCV